jgi:hypothetical protein
MSTDIKTPEVSVMMERVLKQRTELSTKQEKLSSSGRRSNHGMCATRTGTCGTDKFTPFILVGVVPVDVVVEVSLAIIAEEFTSDAP